MAITGRRVLAATHMEDDDLEQTDETHRELEPPEPECLDVDED